VPWCPWEAPGARTGSWQGCGRGHTPAPAICSQPGSAEVCVARTQAPAESPPAGTLPHGTGPDPEGTLGEEGSRKMQWEDAGP